MLVFLRTEYYKRMLKAQVSSYDEVTFIKNTIDTDKTVLIRKTDIFLDIYPDNVQNILYEGQMYKIKYAKLNGYKKLCGIIIKKVSEETDYSNR